MINELQLIGNIDLLFERKIILYGAGYLGVSVYGTLQFAGIPINFFCDSNPEKWGKCISGIEIISLEQLKKLDEKEEIVIIITTDQALYMMQIFDNIEKLQIKTDKILTMHGLEILFAQNVNNPRISGQYREFLLQTSKLRKDLTIYKKKNTEVAFLLREGSSDKDILVYSPPKVGSSTVASSVSANGFKCFHAHFYTNICGRTLEESNLIMNMLKRLKTTKIINIVREPLSRGVSGLFQHIDILGAYGIMSLGDSFVDACTKWIKKRAFELNSENSCYGFEFDWFDRELKTVFGIDVFAHPFDREKGYSVIKQGNIEVLLMKLEKLNSLEKVIGEFVGTPYFKLITANEGNNKPYRYLYKNVKEVMKIPREVVSLYYDNNPRMDHFYSDEEKATFLKKWEKNISE